MSKPLQIDKETQSKIEAILGAPDTIEDCLAAAGLTKDELEAGLKNVDDRLAKEISSEILAKLKTTKTRLTPAQVALGSAIVLAIDEQLQTILRKSRKPMTVDALFNAVTKATLPEPISRQKLVVRLKDSKRFIRNARGMYSLRKPVK